MALKPPAIFLSLLSLSSGKILMDKPSESIEHIHTEHFGQLIHEYYK